MAGKSVLFAVSLCLLALLTGCASRRHQAHVRAAESGATAFQSYCAACHQYDGQGMGSAPPLAAPWVTGPEDRLIRIVLHGVRGPMQVQGKSYDLEMPGFGKILSDSDVAALLTFVRRRYGAYDEPITAAAVSRVRTAHSSRTDYWSAAELLKEP